MSQEMRLETEAEHLARDMREGRFPEQSERQMVPVAPTMTASVEAKKALEGVTPGPWQADSAFCYGDHPVRVAMPDWAGVPQASICECEHNWNDADCGERRISWKEAEANARFIAWAREGVPALLAENAAKDAEIAELRHQIHEATDENFIWGAMDNVHDAETTLDDYASAVSRAQRAALQGDTHE